MTSIKTYNSYSLCWEWRNSTGQLHREDGPAREYDNGEKYWYQNSLIHREDGPAIEWANGYKSWYYYGKPISCKSQEEFEKLIKLQAFW